jgi:hypothetical protein
VHCEFSRRLKRPFEPGRLRDEVYGAILDTGLEALSSIGVTTRLRFCFIVTAVGEMHLMFSSATAPAPEPSVAVTRLLVLRPTSAWSGGDHDGSARSWPTTSLYAAPRPRESVVGPV